MLRLSFFALCFVVCVYAEHQATVTLSGEKVKGVVKFTKTDKGVVVEGNVTGLTPGKHGFHVHQFGDLSNGCATTGGHFNPLKKNHGARDATERHVGDLGNIEADDKGVATISLTDHVIDLEGDNNIIGRAIVVHEGEDDYGLGGHDDSLTTGHAGGRVACGIIGRL
ncbi:superoxide dismutase [Cu-Zn] isoform X2 [Atheta coriaria]